MVVSTASNLTKSTMDPQPLKFGMDRILSEETPLTNKNLVHCSSAPPCANCLTSLYRCCRDSSYTTGTSNYYKTVIHVPQPLRPYNVKGDAAIQVSLQQSNPTVGNSKRKRSWSRAVFSNLQRKGLEKRFQLQKYITKPDRRQLAATLGLSDAQVKVWFQNRRMKWRHMKEAPGQNFATSNDGGHEASLADSGRGQQSDSDCGSDIDVQTVDS